MTDTDTPAWQDRTLTEAQQKNREAASLMPVSRSGALPMDFAQMVDYAKFMATARGAVGAHLNGNVGACLAVMEIAKQFDMPAYAVARQSYFVNGRMAFMGQFVHAIINKYCPLKKKLSWSYSGEGPTLKIIISGEFKDEVEPRVWESPMLKDIAVKNSPLWVTNPKHQLIYFGVRAWQTVNWPEGLLSIQTDDEVAAMEPLRWGADNALDVTPGAALRERLAAANSGKQHEGHKEGFTDSELLSAAAYSDASREFEETEKTESAIPEGFAAVENALKAATSETAMATTNVIINTLEPPPAKPKRGRPPKTREPAPISVIPDDTFPGDKPLPESPHADGPPAPPSASPTPLSPAAHDEAVSAPLPKYAGEWAIYCRTWLQEYENDPTKTDQDAMLRWNDERGLRNDCGVTSAERDPVFIEYGSIIERMRRGDQK